MRLEKCFNFIGLILKSDLFDLFWTDFSMFDMFLINVHDFEWFSLIFVIKKSNFHGPNIIINGPNFVFHHLRLPGPGSGAGSGAGSGPGPGPVQNFV